ncbi:unnamed protein product [Nesidiocoris tenuis]|nr:unnamed protein product [Nesidiocoris tenuis]
MAVTESLNSKLTLISNCSDFSGRVVNNDHFLYWGEVTKTTDEGIDLHFQLIEQTEFIDDSSFQAFKGMFSIGTPCSSTSKITRTSVTTSSLASRSTLGLKRIGRVTSSKRTEGYRVTYLTLEKRKASSKVTLVLFNRSRKNWRVAVGECRSVLPFQKHRTDGDNNPRRYQGNHRCSEGRLQVNAGSPNRN